MKSFLPFIDRLIKVAPVLETLPLFLGHLDLNEMNILEKVGR
jgi:hypothetical protein